MNLSRFLLHTVVAFKATWTKEKLLKKVAALVLLHCLSAPVAAHAETLWNVADAAISQHQASIWDCGNLPSVGEPASAFHRRLAATAKIGASRGRAAIGRFGCTLLSYSMNGPGHAISILEMVGSPTYSPEGDAFIPAILTSLNGGSTGYNFAAIVVVSKSTLSRPPRLIAYSAPDVSMDEVTEARELIGKHPIPIFPGVTFPSSPEARRAAAVFARMSFPGMTDPQAGFFICPDRLTSASILTVSRKVKPSQLVSTVVDHALAKCHAGKRILRTIGAWDFVSDSENLYQGGWFAVTAVADGKPVEVLQSWYLMD